MSLEVRAAICYLVGVMKLLTRVFQAINRQFIHTAEVSDFPALPPTVGEIQYRC